MPIKKLPPLVANQIAAGEVVERPASVIKELAENSLDAAADKIEIELTEGGRKSILIRDNGFGIAKNDLALALERHATSKIENIDDLDDLSSFGFRGEALASIASVARVTLTSRQQGCDEAWQIAAAGSADVSELVPASHPQGTSVLVEDIFFNTPARRRFLRSVGVEQQHAVDAFRRMALSRFDASFKLTANGKILYNLPAAKSDEDRLARVGKLLGGTFAQQAWRIDFDKGSVRIWGWVTEAPEIGRSSSPQQHIFINGRPVKDKTLAHAMKQAYSEIYGRDVSPDYLLYLEMNPSEVDVNVHPTKHEVRFGEPRLMHDLLLTAVHSVFVQRGKSFAMVAGTHSYGSIDDSGSGDENSGAEEFVLVPDYESPASALAPAGDSFAEGLDEYARNPGNGNSFASAHQHSRSWGGGLIRLPKYGTALTSAERRMDEAYRNYLVQQKNKRNEASFENGPSEYSSEADRGELCPAAGISQGGENSCQTCLCAGRFKILLQNACGVYAVDIKTLTDICCSESLGCETSILLVPMKFSVTPSQASFIKSRENDFENLGFKMIAGPGPSFRLLGVPKILRGSDLGSFANCLLEGIGEMPQGDLSLRQVIADAMAKTCAMNEEYLKNRASCLTQRELDSEPGLAEKISWEEILSLLEARRDE